MIQATVTLEDWADILDLVNVLVRGNVRWMKKHGVIDLYGGAFVYRLEKKNKCGAERWQKIKQILRQKGPPYEIECEEAASLLRAILIVSGEDKKAKCRLIQIATTAHVQVVSKGKILDPSVVLGMPVPKRLQTKIYELDFKGEP